MFDFDPVASPIALVVVLVFLWLMIKAVKTVVKLGLLLVVAVGIYVFLYGDQLT